MFGPPDNNGEPGGLPPWDTTHHGAVNSASRNTAPVSRSTRSASERASMAGIIGNSGVSRKNAGRSINTPVRRTWIVRVTPVRAGNPGNH